MLPRAASDFYALQQRVNAQAAAEVGRLWRKMGDDFDTSWRRLAPAVLSVLIEAQDQTSRAALDYVPRVLAETGIPDEPEGDFRYRSLVGVASDGRPLASLAYGGVAQAKQAVGDGASTGTALAQGGSWMDLMVKLQVADAARQAVGVMTSSRKNLSGTIRVLNPPSCQRCAILAGRFYRWSTGFDRHPRCDCVNMPSASAGWARAEGFITDPMDAYRAGQIRDLTEAQRFAIDNGADITRVVNATRGMSTTATRRPPKVRKSGPQQPKPTVPPGQIDLLAGIRFNQPTAPDLGLLTPEGIYREAAGDRDKAIRLLREWGYIT
jgi:hypothetical protein